ncbi:unnamed protein product, partial [Didymodactylos carnosus]
MDDTDFIFDSFESAIIDYTPDVLNQFNPFEDFIQFTQQPEISSEVVNFSSI